MIPIRDENPTRRFPWLTLALIAANVTAFVHLSMLDPRSLEMVWTQWSVVPARFLADPFSPHEMATLFTSMFMHGGLVHLLGNMLYLWIFGNNVEDRLGPARFLGFYLACGVAAALTQIAAAPYAEVPMLGASGAIAGVLAAYLLLFPGAAVVTIIPVLFFVEVARVPAYLVIGFWFVLQLGNGLASLSTAATAGGTAWFAHIGGFIAGLVLALPARSSSRRRS